MKKSFLLNFSLFVLLMSMFLFFSPVNATANSSSYDSSASSYALIHSTSKGTRSYDGYLYIDGEYILVNFANTLTPNGSEVGVYETMNDFSSNHIASLNNSYDSAFSLATRLAPATARYNCHSYAWYSQNTNSNHYWMNNPQGYYDTGDMSYEEVTGNMVPRLGDIICYFDNNGTINDTSDDVNVHSGIVLDYDPTITSNNVCGNSNQFTVKSKWGVAGVYQHKGDYCPYTSSAYGNPADYIKLYRPRTNATYTLTQSNPFFEESLEVNNNSSSIIYKYEMYELNINYSSSYQMIISSSYPVNVRLYDVHMQLIINNPTNTYSNGTYSVIINPYLSSGNKYYLRVSYQNISNTGIIITHMHNYTYTWVNYIKHRQSCNCGISGLQAHVVSPDAYNSGQQYATCLLCGGNALIDNYNKSFNDYPYTVNGSFILPNGVIVLEEDDMDAYIEGNLIFIYPNKNSIYDYLLYLFDN